jgi:prolipoprotein diacylglyceryl transferase
MPFSPPAFIPSPSNGTVNVGPLPLHVYGLLLAIGVVIATLIAERRWERWGHERRELGDMIVVIVIAGVVGARLYHVATDYQLFEGHWIRVLEIWRGGLSIWGVLIGGIAAILVMTRIRKVDTLGIMDAIAPGIILAQALGRWGNYFNQELFGEPTRLPWGLEIDRAHRPAGYTQFTTFHPTFLYESLYLLAMLVVLLACERRFVFRRGQSVALYLALYTFGRFWFENLRIDPAHHLLGLRVNAWVSLLVWVGATAWFVWLGRHGSVDPTRYPDAVTTPADDPDHGALNGPRDAGHEIGRGRLA